MHSGACRSLSPLVCALLLPVRRIHLDGIKSGPVNPGNERRPQFPGSGEVARVDERTLLACAGEANHKLADLKVLDCLRIARQLIVVQTRYEDVLC